MLPRDDRRGPAIEAVRRKLVTPTEMIGAYEHTVGMKGRAELGELIGLLDAGCESELEIWGMLGVFDVPGLRHGERQLWVEIRGERYRVDLGFGAERLAVEMDGDRWHSSRERRERDRRRDAAFAGIGWLTLRFSWERLHVDIEGCRRDTLAALAARRSMRHAG